MGKWLLVLVALFVTTACSAVSVRYNPDPMNVTNPFLVIKNTIQQQPTAYADIPDYVEVDDQCFKHCMGSPNVTLKTVDIGNISVGQSDSNASCEPVCYKNIGKVNLYYYKKDNLWRVKINDKNENYMYEVYSYDKADAEKFIDALHHFVKQQPNKYK